MSAAEIIEQIKALPPEEQAKVADFVKNGDAAKAGKQGVDDEFKRIADKVFSTNAELFRKLAQ